MISSLPRSAIVELVAIFFHTSLVESTPRLAKQFSSLSYLPHPLVLSFLALWLTERITGVFPHLPTRLCERLLQRPHPAATLPWLLLPLIYKGFQIAWMYYYHGTAPQLELPLDLPSSLPKCVVPVMQIVFQRILPTTMTVMALLVVPVLLQLNHMYPPPLWSLLLLLGIRDDGGDTSSTHSACYNSLLFESIVVEVLAGGLAARWMHRYFPDDPTVGSGVLCKAKKRSGKRW